jgi:hypothetical protein
MHFDSNVPAEGGGGSATLHDVARGGNSGDAAPLPDHHAATSGAEAEIEAATVTTAANAAALLPPALRAVPLVAPALDGWGGFAMSHGELACRLAALAAELAAAAGHLSCGAPLPTSCHSDHMAHNPWRHNWPPMPRAAAALRA